MATPSPDEIDEHLRVLSIAVNSVGDLRQSMFDAFATEQSARHLLFQRLAEVISPVLPAIAEITDVDALRCDGGDAFYLEIDERKGKIWYLGRRGDETFVAAALQRKDAARTVVPTAEALRVIRLDELVRRVGARLRSATRGMGARRDEARSVARTMDAVAVLLDA